MRRESLRVAVVGGHLHGRSLDSTECAYRNAKGEWWTLEKSKRDVTLFHPRSVYEEGRPTWLRLGGDRKPYELPRDVCGDAARCLVRARSAHESEDAVPIDQVEVIPGESIPALMLPVGDFVLEFEDAQKAMSRRAHIKTR